MQEAGVPPPAGKWPERGEKTTVLTAQTSASAGTISVQVKFGGRTLAVAVTPDTTVKELKSLLQPLTNVLPRGQKLIFKGKVLTDTMSLKMMKIVDGSKLMLIASQGLHQGDGPINKDATSISSGSRIIPDAHETRADRVVTVVKGRLERWRITGVVALPECSLKVIPEEVWECGLSVRVLDASKNFIHEISDKISTLKSLNKLILNANNLSDGSVSWEGLASLKALKVLSLSQNNLTTLPSSLGGLTSLSQLHVANNKLTSLPAELGLLKELEILKASNNRMCSVPSSIGNCSLLVELDLASNLLVELPETLGNLRNLKALHLSNNGLKSLPSTLFKMCSQLSILNLHGTEITNEILRKVEGWEAFDERRRSKHQKQLDFRVGSSGVFDEGADDSHGS